VEMDELHALNHHAGDGGGQRNADPGDDGERIHAALALPLQAVQHMEQMQIEPGHGDASCAPQAALVPDARCDCVQAAATATAAEAVATIPEPPLPDNPGSPHARLDACDGPIVGSEDHEPPAALHVALPPLQGQPVTLGGVVVATEMHADVKSGEVETSIPQPKSGMPLFLNMSEV
jgi:hypothetical protein